MKASAVDDESVSEKLNEIITRTKEHKSSHRRYMEVVKAPCQDILLQDPITSEIALVQCKVLTGYNNDVLDDDKYKNADWSIFTLKEKVLDYKPSNDRNNVEHRISLDDLNYIVKNSDLDPLFENVQSQKNMRLDDKLTHALVKKAIADMK